MHTSARSREDKSRFSLIANLRDDMGNLIQEEVHLAKKVMSEKVSQFGRNGRYLGIGAVVALQIGLGTGLAGFVLVRAARILGRHRAV